MKRFIGVTVITLLVLGSAGRVRADDKGATALIDKAIKALGGEEVKLPESMEVQLPNDWSWRPHLGV